MFTIHLNNLKFFAFHGLHEEEGILGTDFEVSVSISFNTSVKVLHLKDSIDYVSAYQIIKKIFDIPEKLLETLAQTIVDALYDFDKRITIINISIEKINPPISNFVGRVGVSYSKSFI
jgi:dihydroneopterin aldolase